MEEEKQKDLYELENLINDLNDLFNDLKNDYFINIKNYNILNDFNYTKLLLNDIKIIKGNTKINYLNKLLDLKKSLYYLQKDSNLLYNIQFNRLFLIIQLIYDIIQINQNLLN